MGPFATAALSFFGVDASVFLPPNPSNKLFAPAPEPTEKPRTSRRSGAGNRLTYGLMETLDNNVDLRGVKWYGSPGKLGIAQKMMRDPHVRQSIEYIAGPLAAANWKFTTWSRDPLDVEVADFLTWAFFERLPWDVTVRRWVQRYASTGFSLEEMTDDNQRIPASRFPLHSGGGKGLIPTGFHEIPSATIDRWYQDKLHPERLAGVRQYLQGSDTEPAGWRDVHTDRVVRITYDQQGADYTGFPVLRSAYQPWKLKMAFLSYDAIKHERVSVPVPTIYLAPDATDEDIDVARQIAAEMRAHEKGYMIFPNGYKFEWSGSGESNSTNLNLAIERCNTDIAVNVGAGFTRLGLTGPGSFALGQTQQGVYHLAVKNHANLVASALRVGNDGWSPAERIVRLNYGPDVEVPFLVAKNLPSRPIMEITKTFISGVQVGAFTADDTTEDELREGLEIGPRDPATARRTPTAQAQPIPEKQEPREPMVTVPPMEENAATE